MDRYMHRQRYNMPTTRADILPGCSFEGVGDGHGVFVEQYYYL